MRIEPRAVLFFVLIGVAALVSEAWQPPDVVPSDAPADAFSASRAFGQLQTLLREQHPHPVGSPANAVVRRRIEQRLKELGYASEVQAYRSCERWPCISLQNVVSVVPGSEGQMPSAEHPAVMLTAHYDSVPQGPGASDDGAGVAALLEIARAIRHRQRSQRPLILLFSDGEEAGLLGAKGFVAAHPFARFVDVVVNLEARGTAGSSVMFETAGGNAALIETMSKALSRPVSTSLFALVYANMPNDTDLSVYGKAGLRGYNFAFIRAVENYHTTRDDLAHLDRRSLQHHGDNALALVEALLNSPRQAKTGDAVWFDVLASVVVWWPLSWTLAFALVVFGLGGAFCRRVHLRVGFRTTHWRDGMLSLSKTMFALLYIVGLLILVIAVGGLRLTPGKMVSSLSVAALVCIWGMRCLARQSYPIRLSVYWGMHAFLGVLTAVFVPEVSYLFIVPAAVAIVCLFLLRPEEASSKGWRATLVAAFPLAATALLWLPLAIGFRDALDALAMPFIAASAVPVFGCLIPVMPLRGPDTGRLAGLLLLVFCVGLFV